MHHRQLGSFTTDQRQQNILSNVRQYVLSAMAKNDPAHDSTHVQRVVRLTVQLCAAYPQTDSFRAQLLAWLHDLHDDKLPSDTGTDTLRALLRTAGTPEADISFILEALPYISYRKHPKLGPQTPLEIRIVQDADRIDAMGAMGIARTFAYGGAKNRPLEDSLAHFDQKLLLLYDLLSTDAAKELALPRFEFLKSFYKQYQDEL